MNANLELDLTYFVMIFHLNHSWFLICLVKVKLLNKYKYIFI